MKSSKFSSCLALLLATVSLTALSVPAQAQQSQTSRERGSIIFGAFITNRDTTTRLDSETETGTPIDLEGDLGLDGSMTVFRFGGDFWVGERHRFDASIFDMSRSASRQIDETFVIGDTTFDIDTTVTANNDLTIYKADYTYAFLSRDRGYLGATGGLYVASTKFAVSETSGLAAESESLTAPLPVIGLRGDYDITDKITLTGSSQWFGIDTGDVSGNLRDFYLAADYRLSSRWAVGLAYNDVSMNITAEKRGGYLGQINWGYDGWLAYVKFDFLR